MRTPVDMQLDTEIGAAVLRYGNSPTRRSLPIGHDIVFDISDDGDLLDIELLTLTEAVIDQAAVLADGYHCQIPDEMRERLINWNLAAA